MTKKNTSLYRKKRVTGRGQPKNLLEAVREVGNEAFTNVYKLALEREALRRQGVEPPPLLNELPEESELETDLIKEKALLEKSPDSKNISDGFPTLLLASGRKIGAEAIFAYRTYANLLVGIPNERLNNEHLALLPQQMKALFSNAPVFVIPPLRWTQSGEWPKGSGHKIELLPAVVLAALFTSEPLVDGFKSRVVIVWHQHAAFPFIADFLLPRFESLDWEAIAEDW